MIVVNFFPTIKESEYYNIEQFNYTITDEGLSIIPFNTRSINANLSNRTDYLKS